MTLLSGWALVLATRPQWLVASALTLSLLLSVGLALLPAALPSPQPGSPAVRFVADMTAHHAQAVDMAARIARRTGDEPLGRLAQSIHATQAKEAGQMRALLRHWGQAAPSATMSAAHAAYMGMATPEQLRQLDVRLVADAERLFLQLMIRHHEGALRMARPFQGWFTRPEVRGMASHVRSVQTGEIAVMTRLLRERKSRPLPALPADMNDHEH